jgi:hypothetical protein
MFDMTRENIKRSAIDVHESDRWDPPVGGPRCTPVFPDDLDLLMNIKGVH